MPYFIGYILFHLFQMLVGKLGKKIAYFTIYVALFTALAIGFFSGINIILGQISHNVGLGFTELNSMLPSGVTTVMSFYFSSKAVMWSFLAQYKYMNMKKIFLK